MHRNSEFFFPSKMVIFHSHIYIYIFIHVYIYIYIYTFKRLPEGNITQVWAEFGMVLDETLADFGPFRIVHSSYNYD